MPSSPSVDVIVLVRTNLILLFSAAFLICSDIKYWSFIQVQPVLIISINDNILALYISSSVSFSSLGHIFSFNHSYKLHPSVVSLNMLIGTCECAFISPGIIILFFAFIIYASLSSKFFSIFFILPFSIKIFISSITTSLFLIIKAFPFFINILDIFSFLSFLNSS